MFLLTLYPVREWVLKHIFIFIIYFSVAMGKCYDQGQLKEESLLCSMVQEGEYLVAKVVRQSKWKLRDRISHSRQRAESELEVDLGLKTTAPVMYSFHQGHTSKDSITSPNSVTSWGSRIQIHKPVGEQFSFKLSHTSY